MSTSVSLSPTETRKLQLSAGASGVAGLFVLLSSVLGSTGVIGVVAGCVLLANGVVIGFAGRHRGTRLIVDDDAVARDVNARNTWRLRWAHMAAVRFVPDALWLVPLAEVASHPQIAPALEPREVDGVVTPTFAVPLDPRVADAVRAAITQHAPPRLLGQSSPRPPAT